MLPQQINLYRNDDVPKLIRPVKQEVQWFPIPNTKK